MLIFDVYRQFVCASLLFGSSFTYGVSCVCLSEFMGWPLCEAASAASHPKRQGSQRRKLQPPAATSAAARTKGARFVRKAAQKISQRRFTQAARGECDMCEREFDVRWHSCDMCEREFKRAGDLKLHRAFVHDIDVRWHSCDMCEKTSNRLEI